MDDKIIIENMKAVLKSTKKKKAVTNQNNRKGTENSRDDELISNLMSKNWQIKSPNNDNDYSKNTTNNLPSNKILTNAFEKLMNATKKASTMVVDSPLTQKSDKSPIFASKNGIKSKKKRNHHRKRKNDSEKFETESDLSVLDEESLHDTSFFFSNSRKNKTKQSNITEISPSSGYNGHMPLEQIFAGAEDAARKRNRTSDCEQKQQPEKYTKRRKTREVLLDSNENSLPNTQENDLKKDEEEEEKQISGRPKRSCSNRVDYAALLDSPEKESLRKRKNVLKSKHGDDSSEIIEIDENSPVKKQQKAKNPVKLAPLFIKKPPIDPSIIEARRNFLLSELPSNLRAAIDKQRKFDEEFLMNKLIGYPTIAHVRQEKSFFIIDYNNKDDKLYSESKIIVRALEKDYDEDRPQQVFKRGSICDYKKNTTVSGTREPVENIKASVRAIKEKCENFPTNRCFKQILHKLKTARNNDSGVENLNLSYQHSLFIDIFKPMGFEDYLIGVEPIKRLQEFLTTWNEKNFRNEYYGSDDDESSSRHSTTRGSNNFVVLSGKHGSGKSSSVYALANDLNYEVIEINAGSKRNGKKILQDLLEATQSHRVEKHLVEDEHSQSEGFSGNVGGNGDVDKRTIILIEDAELTFENDDGFISSIQQLINISKRPVILTTNDRSCQHLQKFLQHNEIIYDNPKSYVTEYLSLISLATSSYKIDEAEIEHLYALNSFDLRKTINEIEFFIRSDSAIINGGSLMGLYGNNIKNLTSESKRNRKSKLHGKKEHQKKGKDLSKLRFDSSIISSQCTSLMSLWHTKQLRSSSRGDQISYHQHNFMNEMANYFERSNVLQMEYEHDFAQRQQHIISRSISNEINAGNVSTRAKVLDFSPMLRNICRTEKKRESSRRSSRNHYLKYFMSNNMNLSEYFDEQSKIFELDS